MNCPKCGVDVIDTQKICPQCGAFLPASGYFYQDERKFRLTPQMKKAATIVAGFLLLLLIIKAFMITPPDRVATAYVELLTKRDVGKSNKMVTSKFTEDLQEAMRYMSDISGELFLFTPPGTDTTFSSVVERYDSIEDPTEAWVAVTINNSQNGPKVVRLQLVKQGRRWYINQLLTQ